MNFSVICVSYWGAGVLLKVLPEFQFDRRAQRKKRTRNSGLGKIRARSGARGVGSAPVAEA